MNNYHIDEEDITSKYVAAQQECGDLLVAVYELQEQVKTLTALAERKTKLIDRFLDEVEDTLYGLKYFDADLIKLRAACQVYRVINNINYINADKDNNREGPTG
jgi:hypothetical protein